MRGHYMEHGLPNLQRFHKLTAREDAVSHINYKQHLNKGPGIPDIEISAEMSPSVFS